eukprot:3792095-Prymnesium_polylepis.1
MRILLVIRTSTLACRQRRRFPVGRARVRDRSADRYSTRGARAYGVRWEMGSDNRRTRTYVTYGGTRSLPPRGG